MAARRGIARQRRTRFARSFARDAAAAHRLRRCGNAARSPRQGGVGARLLIGIVGPGFVTSTLGVVLQPYTANGPLLPGITAATVTGALLAIRFVIESAAAPALGATSDRWGIRRTATRFFLLGGAALLAACAQPDSLPLLALFMLAFFASSTALHSGVSASVSSHGSAAYARYVTAGDIGSAAGPLLGWIAVDLFGYAAIGLLLRCGGLSRRGAGRARVSALTSAFVVVYGCSRPWCHAAPSCSRCHSTRSCARPCERHPQLDALEHDAIAAPVRGPRYRLRSVDAAVAFRLLIDLPEQRGARCDRLTLLTAARCKFDSRGRVFQYASDSASVTGSTTPELHTCRASASQ